MPTLKETARALVRAYLRNDRLALSTLWRQLSDKSGADDAAWAIGEVCAHDPEFQNQGHDVRRGVIHFLTWLHPDDFYVGGSRT